MLGKFSQISVEVERCENGYVVTVTQRSPGFEQVRYVYSTEAEAMQAARDPWLMEPAHE